MLYNNFARYCEGPEKSELKCFKMDFSNQVLVAPYRTKKLPETGIFMHKLAINITTFDLRQLPHKIPQFSFYFSQVSQSTKYARFKQKFCMEETSQSVMELNYTTREVKRRLKN